jgi:hypothetical protein
MASGARFGKVAIAIKGNDGLPLAHNTSIVCECPLRTR